MMESNVYKVKTEIPASVQPEPLKVTIENEQIDEVTVAPVPRYSLSTVLLEIIWGCNLRCVLCNSYKLPKKIMPFEQIRDVLDKIPTLQKFIVIGQGEPLLHPDWLKIMEIVVERGLFLHVVTNGMLLTDEVAMAFPPKAMIQFSIDSFRSEIYKEMRPNVDLIKVLRNLERLANLRNDLFIGIQSIITKKTYPYIEEIYQFCRNFGFSFSVLYPGTNSREQQEEIYPDQPHPLKVVTSPQPCQAPFNSIQIGIDGEIFPCCFIYGSLNKEKPDDYHIEDWLDGKAFRPSAKQYRMGNIWHDDVYKIWNEQVIREVRNSISNSMTKRKEIEELRKEFDCDDEKGYEYCKVCSLRWGKIC